MKNATARQHEEKVIEEKIRLPSTSIYEIISTGGREELDRPFQSLAWSGFVAGLCISFSLFCEGFLQLWLPEAAPYTLVANLGYTVGFLIVILSRFQLFTENTITVILPLLERFSLPRLSEVMRLWSIVLAGNLAGTFMIALLITHFAFFSAAQMETLLEISHLAVDRDLIDIFLQAIPAGFLIAALVWMMPSAESAHFWVIFLITYVIAVGDFAHIIAGSAEAFLLMLGGQTGLGHGLGYLVMACLGNIVGGTGLFAGMAYAQVQKEM